MDEIADRSTFKICKCYTITTIITSDRSWRSLQAHRLSHKLSHYLNRMWSLKNHSKHLTCKHIIHKPVSYPLSDRMMIIGTKLTQKIDTKLLISLLCSLSQGLDPIHSLCWIVLMKEIFWRSKQLTHDNPQSCLFKSCCDLSHQSSGYSIRFDNNQRLLNKIHCNKKREYKSIAKAYALFPLKLQDLWSYRLIVCVQSPHTR